MTARGSFPAYLLTSDDGGILLDLANNLFLKLNPLGVQIWTALSGGVSPADVAAQLASQYSIDVHRAASDVEHLLTRASEAGLPPGPFQTAEPQEIPADTIGKSFPWYGPELETAPKPRRLQILEAIMGLVTFDLVLATASLQGLCERIQGWPVKRRLENLQAPNPGQICAAVEQACLCYPKKSLCLQRSAVTTCLLRREGFPAQMVLAVRVMPFMAHAWVELNGHVINDRPQVKRLYRVLARY